MRLYALSEASPTLQFARRIWCASGIDMIVQGKIGAVVVLTLFVLLLAFIVWGLGVLAARRRREGAIRPQCGRCGHPVAGLPTFICPECGGDLHEWGIRTQAMAAETAFERISSVIVQQQN